jgi:hypothetical protein
MNTSFIFTAFQALLVASILGSANAAPAPITAADHDRLLSARSANSLRFERDFKGNPFSATAQFESVIPSPTSLLSGYIATFWAGTVKIMCVIDSRKNIDTVTNLNRGDSIQIKATFNASNLADNYKGFFFRNCNFSAAK